MMSLSKKASTAFQLFDSCVEIDVLFGMFRFTYQGY